MTVYMRSNDIYFGLPYDYLYFVSLGEYIAKQLNISFSTYHHIVTSMHLYTRDECKFDKHDQVVNININEIIENTKSLREVEYEK